MPFDGFLNASYSWQDDVNFDLLQNPKTEQGSYAITNISLGINERERDRYRVTLFVENLFDEDYAAAVTDLSGLYGNASTIFQFLPRNAERYSGVRLRYSF